MPRFQDTAALICFDRTPREKLYNCVQNPSVSFISFYQFRIERTILPEKPLASILPAPRIAKRTRWIVLLWLVAAISIGGLAVTGPPGDVTGFDAVCYVNAMRAIAHGGDPYIEGMAVQNAYIKLPTYHDGDHIPMIYVYPPMTLPVLRVLTRLPDWGLRLLYWSAIAAAFLLQLWAGYRMASEKERRWLIYLLPFVAFFPGLLSDWTILSGNVAGILYGLILAAAVPGWKRDKWLWFYVAVFAASIWKPQLLTLLAFPILTGRKQWLPVCTTGAAGTLIFAIQSLLWPVQFHEFFQVAHMQHLLRHDFGFGPVGMLSEWLWRMNIPYSSTATIAYLVWAVALGILMLTISHRVHRRPLLREYWIPVALVGTILLNLRTTCCDTAAITVPLILIAWRGLLSGQKFIAQWKERRAGGTSVSATAPAPTQPPCHKNLALVALSLFVACNLLDILWTSWLPIEGLVLLGVFALGLWTLLRPASSFFQEKPSPLMP